MNKTSHASRVFSVFLYDVAFQTYSTVLCASTVLTSFHVGFSSVRLYQSTASLLNLDCQPTIKCLYLVDVYNSQRMPVVSKVLNGKPWRVNCGSPVGSLLLILLYCDFTDTHWKMSPLTWTKCLWWCRRRDSRTRRATIRRCPGPESISGSEASAGSCWGAGRWSVAGTSTPLFCYWPRIMVVIVVLCAWWTHILVWSKPFSTNNNQ